MSRLCSDHAVKAWYWISIVSGVGTAVLRIANFPRILSWKKIAKETLDRIIVVSLMVALASWSTLAPNAPTRIIANGVVLTMDKNDHRAEAVAIDGDRIVAVGGNAEIRKLAGAETEVVDVGGRTVIPGLIDAHLHAIRGG